MFFKTRKLAGIFAALCLFFHTQSPAQTSSSESDLSALYDLVYQIVVIETETKNKSALGSGFQISADGLVITNYHVISNFVFEPEHHAIEYVQYDGEKGELSLIYFDVINDLAVLQRDEPPVEHLPLATDIPSLGESIYALGNPRDVGMLMVSGAYNGLADYSYTDQILFSGSLNPGMSGGPTVNKYGQVVGVNVATAGSQLSFLVPVSKVYDLLEHAAEPLAAEGYTKHISSQVNQFQDAYFSQLLALDWELETLGESVRVPGEMGLDTNCWGSTNEDDEDRNIEILRLVCNNSNSIYLQPRLNTGVLHYSYEFNSAIDLSPYRFHKLISGGGYYPDNSASNDDVTQFECTQKYLETDELGNSFAQTGFCSRAYVDIEGMYDILFYKTVSEDTRSLTSHFTLAGVSDEIALAFTQRFMEEVQWK
ncbi:serine protease [Alteromonas sp. ASW11-36]|uniref:Serine protease n=1 Tax=Alteromonas arenosi TaxID=3055817 RepID=A0ABT7SXM8_9ALTE|nr:serine protease [Alteromonas sp. ASW11-36]MDM7860950.1 serine protease [Alteromonas sp. ASW11-36]